jgi:two-component system, response regulator YesN
MIKVLLVDDERLALEYLENIISWEYYGFQLIGVTTDSEQALQLYKKYKPELVISDVKMPGMNGLELVNEIRDYGGKSHILFLSAYKNFDYVKQAIRLDIDDYLLKSDLQEETFLKKILNLKEEIDKEKAKSQYTTGIIMEELFNKNTPEEHYKLILDENDYIRIHKKYFYIILAQKIPPRFLDKYFGQSGLPAPSFEFEFSNACHSFQEDSQIQTAGIVAINKNEYLAVLNVDSSMITQMDVTEKLYEFSRRIFSKMNQEQEHQFDIYYYNKKMSLRQFGRFYHENKNQLSQRYLKKRAQIMEFNEFKNNEQQMKEPKSITSEEIYQMIKQKKKENIEQCMQIINKAVTEESYFSYLWYIKNMFEAISFFEGALSGAKSGRKFSLIENSALYDFRNPNDLVDFITFKLEEIWYIISESETIAYSSVISSAIRCIREKYCDPQLTSAVVAGNINISTSWLSTKFKEEVGIGVSDFINNVRIEHAKKMLDEKDYMVYEVSEQVGFTSSQYFSKIFKDFVGVTPNRYRKNHMDKEGLLHETEK